MKRQTFGVSGSIYLTTQVLRLAAIDHKEHPHTLNIIQQHFM